MPAVRVSINPTMLAWAMKQAGVSQHQLASDLGITSDLIAAWLSGDSQPATGQFRALAKALRRPTSVFFLPRPPTTSVAPAAFRSPISQGGIRTLSQDERDEIRKATRRQKVADWALQQLERSEPPDLPSYSPNAEVVANAAREWLDWRLSYQVKASSKTAVTKALRAALEERNLIVFQISMSDEHCRGFSIAHPSVPLIAYNSKGFTPASRTFTILHELGHLIKNEQAVCERPDDSTERWCDRFAAAFLMPQPDFEAYVRSKIGGESAYVDDDDIKTVDLISNRFKASYQSVALRLIKLGLASWKLYDLVRRPDVEDDKGGFSREPQTTPVKRLREYGYTYVRAVLAARQYGLLSEMDTRKYLDVSGEQLRDLNRRLEVAH